MKCLRTGGRRRKLAPRLLHVVLPEIGRARLRSPPRSASIGCLLLMPTSVTLAGSRPQARSSSSIVAARDRASVSFRDCRRSTCSAPRGTRELPCADPDALRSKRCPTTPMTIIGKRVELSAGEAHRGEVGLAPDLGDRARDAVEREPRPRDDAVFGLEPIDDQQNRQRQDVENRFVDLRRDGDTTARR